MDHVFYQPDFTYQSDFSDMVYPYDDYGISPSDITSTYPTTLPNYPSSPALAQQQESDSESDTSSNSSSSDSEEEQDHTSWGIYNGEAYPTSSLGLTGVPNLPEDAPYMPSTKFQPPTFDFSSPAGLNVLPLPFDSPVSTPPSYSSPAVRTSRLKAASNLQSSTFEGDSDADAEGESDDGGSEDEYIPSPRQAPRERRTYQFAYNSQQGSRSTSGSSRSSTSSPHSTTSSLGCGNYVAPGQDLRFKRTRPRHQQASVPPPASIEQSFAGKDRWKCPNCDYYQKNHRAPDFKRHIATHYRSQERDKWICCGFPSDDVRLKDIDTSKLKIKGTKEPFIWKGKALIGGCLASFSRRDALKRHLDNPNVNCVGDLNAEWIPGNQN